MPYRKSGKIGFNIARQYSFFDKFMDRIFGHFCSCPTCIGDCIQDKRPKIYSKYHGRFHLSFLDLRCLFNYHHYDYNDHNKLIECIRCGYCGV